MNIPLVDLKKQYISIKNEIDTAIKKVIDSGEFILGKELELFEKEFAQYCGVKYAIGVDSGTGALELMLRAFNIGSGDSVMVPVFTFYSTASCVCYTGAKPIFIDVESDTGNIDIEKLEYFLKKNAEKESVKAIIPVHLFGQMVDMDEILSIGKRYNLKIIEDACQAHGALYRNRRAGSMGDAGCFSFYPAKNLGAYGDGGMVITDNKEIAERIKLLRDCGRIEKYTHGVLGWTKRLDTIQAGILRVKLKYIDKWNEERRQNVKIYKKYLEEASIEMLSVRDYGVPVYHMFVVKSSNREQLREYLTNNGIGTGVHYPLPLHLQPVFKFLGYSHGDFPVAEKLSQQVLSLPMFPELTEEEIEKVSKTIIDFSRK